MSIIIKDINKKNILNWNEDTLQLENLVFENTTWNSSTQQYDLALTDTIVIGGKPIYGSFYSTETQTNPTASLVNIMTFNETAFSNGVSIVDNSKIKVTEPGIYNIQFSAQLDKIDSGSDDVDIWFRKNGDDIAWSNTQLTMTGNNVKLVAAWNIFEEANENDYYQIAWSSADHDMRIYAQGTQSTPTRPGIPSVILTINRI